MNYRSIADLSNTIRNNLYKIPRDVDLVVGIPRSGMLAANVIALALNLKVTDLSGFLCDTPLKHGLIRKTRSENIVRPSQAKKILVVDDSINTGNALENTKSLIKSNNFTQSQTILYCAIYASPNQKNRPDIIFEVVKQPRLFEWNVMHRGVTEKSCLDIDGVLCLDPTKVENDDGDAYEGFLLNTLPLHLPSYRVGHLVTSRLEKYRKQTEEWLKQHEIVYDKLHMLNLPDAETRRKLRCHASFKANVYKGLQEAELFIESDDSQAREISKLSGKPVLCVTSQIMYNPNLSRAVIQQHSQRFLRRILNKLRRTVTSLLK